MSSINQFPTFKYSQPDDYHFSHDSVFLAREIFEKLHQEISQANYQILDLCAGCGIVGLDLIFHQLKEASFDGEIDFIEVQNVYKSHFDINIKNLQSHYPTKNLKLNWIEKNYADIVNHKKYDLIISNPPFFLKTAGLLSENNFKNRCRFFLDSDWESMILFMQNSLKEKGRCLFLVRDELKKTIEKEIYFHSKWPKIFFQDQIRGTWIAQMTLS